jgi:hypothetical protein
MARVVIIVTQFSALLCLGLYDKIVFIRFANKKSKHSSARFQNRQRLFQKRRAVLCLMQGKIPSKRN